MNKLIFLLLFVSFLVSCSIFQKQGTNLDSSYSVRFTQPEELNEMEEGRHGFGYCTDGQYLYVINGSATTSPILFADILRYDIKNDKWTELTDKLISKRYCSAEYVNGNIFVFNGTETNRRRNDKCEMVDTETGDIKIFTSNPNPVNKGSSAIWRGKIYIFGGGFYEPGLQNLYSNAVWEFNPCSGKWKLLTQMPEARQVEGEIVNGVLYLIGGYMGQVSYRIDAYNILTDNWSQLEDAEQRISANATAKNGKFIWLVGSYHYFNLLAVFDTVVKKLYLVNSNILGRKHVGAAIIDDQLYVFGGLRSKKKRSIESIQVADISGVERQLTEARAVLINK